MERLKNLPSFVWIFIIMGGIAALVGSCIGSFYLMSEVEGFASVGMLVAAWVVFRVGAAVGESAKDNPDVYKMANVTKAMFILFWAAMGLAIDQTGNYIYNKPIEWLFCPTNTELMRDTETMQTRPGETYVTQNFTCINHDHQVVEEIGESKIIGVHFVEYILLGYALAWLSGLYSRLRIRRNAAKMPISQSG